jgi:hypothetical protein
MMVETVELVGFGQHSPLARFCSLINSDISLKGFLPLCTYGIAIRENNDDLNNR